MKLPILASPEELIQVVQFLKTKAIGCAVEDAKAVIDKKMLDARKVNAYTIWGIIVREGDNKIKLSEIGKRLARIGVSEYPDVFSEVLRSLEPYHNALEWIFYQQDLRQVTNVEIASYWYETKKFGMDVESENTLKDMAVCFFRVCEAAGIGKLYIGRRGQATRLEVNRDHLGQYIGGSTLSKTDPLPECENVLSADGSDDTEPDLAPVATMPNNEVVSSPLVTGDEAMKIFISHGKNMDIVEQIKTLIDLANLDYEVVVETETAAIPIPEKVFSAMRRCNSAVICVSADENDKKEDGTYGINQNVLIEIGSAFVLYDKKVILVWDKRILIPSNLQGLYRCEYTGDELSWGTGIKLMKALNEFKKINH